MSDGFIESPDFRCEQCGNRLGASRDGETAPWLPAPCWQCEAKKSAKAAAARRALGHVAAGVDIDAAFAAYRKLPPFVGNLGPIKLTVGHDSEGGGHGYAATYRRKIRVAYGPHATKAEVLEVLMHEMVHMALPRREAHGERFRLTLRRAARELWGIECPLDVPPQGGVIAYGMDSFIKARLEELIAAGKVETFPAVERPKKTRAEATAALVEKRARHAATMLARAERRLKLAKTLHRRWHEKVSRYERIAAKKGSS